MNDEYLAHYGVKGMRWGIRKVQPDEMQTKLNKLKEKESKYRSKALKTQSAVAEARLYQNKLTTKADKLADRAVKLHREGGTTGKSGDLMARAMNRRLEADRISKTLKKLGVTEIDNNTTAGYKVLMKSEKFRKKIEKGERRLRKYLQKHGGS